MAFLQDMPLFDRGLIPSPILPYANTLNYSVLSS